MHCMNRRNFMKRSVGALAAASTLSGNTAVAASKQFDATALRTLGNTGITGSLLGIGTGTRAWNGSSEQNRLGRKHFVSLLEHAYAEGVRYFDMADMYGVHDYMKDAMKNTVQREDVMLLTKSVSREADLVRADLERFRYELDSDYLDIVLMHCLTEPDWTTKYQPCMDALSEAKAKGKIRAHGVSCHNLGAMKAAAKSPWVDVMLSRINPFEVKMDGTVDEVSAVLREARANGKAVLGMKIAGEGALVDKMGESIKFVLRNELVDAMTIGFMYEPEVGGAMDYIAQA